MRTHSPHRATVSRAALTAALTVTAPLLLTTWAAAPAGAHGAPTDPVSRVSACSPEGGERARSAACAAAVAANGAPFTAWDNLRVAGVNGRDRQLVPDGKLCSGGLPAYLSPSGRKTAIRSRKVPVVRCENQARTPCPSRTKTALPSFAQQTGQVPSRLALRE
ncbi:lytic polysaccharide monooxygenase [Streptomyces bluensis]|uniref:lytic polysaccharide monooxygenase n=1 Tax=Streptomyces bluensis TaxID=33897 RepID=UPI0033205603